jgi:uncharacterized protein DUF4325
MKIISISSEAGTFAENKDVARDLRQKQILPILKKKDERIILDFSNVTGATQSFIHALISEAIRTYGDEVFDRIQFKNCSPTVQEVINIVADYMRES